MRANAVGLPATPRGNTLNLKINVAQCCGHKAMDVTHHRFAFIANQDLSGRIMPPVLINWVEPGPIGQVIDPSDYEQYPGLSGFTTVTIPSGITGGLKPGSYYFNINMRDPYGDITTIMAGTWPIVAVPGLMGPTQILSVWQPQLFDQFPPRVPRRFYAY